MTDKVMKAKAELFNRVRLFVCVVLALACAVLFVWVVITNKFDGTEANPIEDSLFLFAIPVSLTVAHSGFGILLGAFADLLEATVGFVRAYGRPANKA